MKVLSSGSMNSQKWDNYVMGHPNSVLYHLSAWQEIVKMTYGWSAIRMVALDHFDVIKGVLPLIKLRNIKFGKELISMPFFDCGGVLADDQETEKSLIKGAIKLAKRINANNVELRQVFPVNGIGSINFHSLSKRIHLNTNENKIRMILPLPQSSEILFGSFKSKLRSQIRRASKANLKITIGGIELSEDFYKVFSANMKALGSPVHSKKLIQHVLNAFVGKAKIILVYKEELPIACSLIIGFKDVLANPWASSLREYSTLSPNMLLYWSMLKYGCDNGYQFFDFGRSSPDGGTYKFKKQWGAKPSPLHWYCFSLIDYSTSLDSMKNAKFSKAINCWKKMPLPITQLLGPFIRKHIGL